MTKQMSLADLGRRAVACKHWRWMPGCAWIRLPSGAPDDGGDIGRVSDLDADRGARIDGRDRFIPDLSDPATLGCILALVRDAYGDPSFVVRCVAGLWYEESNKRALVARGSDTEAEALVAALEAAP